VLCRNRARAIAAALNFDRQQQVRIATAVSEIARNAFHYASDATAEFSLTRGRTGASRRITQSFVTIVRDRGPGIGDLPSILAGTYQSASGMGMGILGAKRLMDSVHIDTDASGTTVRLVQTLPKGIDLTRSICKTWRPRSATRPKPSRSMSLQRTIKKSPQPSTS
jgi:anti-sigma regulatory factor (Ser/Thr protein kinase)